MAVNPYTEARARANRAFDEKTYKKVLVSLRYDEDGDMIKAFEDAQADGIRSREWLRDLFDNGGISFAKIEQAMRKQGVAPEVREAVLNELK